MHKEDTTHIRAYESDKDKLRLTFKAGSMQDKLFLLLQERWEKSEHSPIVKERSGPTGEYLQCELCGRSENTIEELDQRPCEDGIAVEE